MGSIRLRKKEGLSASAYGVCFLILAFSFVVFSLITPTYTGFATFDAKEPDDVELFLSEDIFDEDDTLTGDLDVSVSGPLHRSSWFYADVGDAEEELLLVDAFNLSEIPFELSEPEMRVKGSSSSRTLVFPDQGRQLFFFSLPRKADVQFIDMNIHGRAYGNDSFPTSLKMDVGLNEEYEWEYLGRLLNYSTNFTLPSGLNEKVENTIIITDEDIYYCENIDLPRAKHFQVSAKYGRYDKDALNLAPDLEAIILSISGSGSTITGEGESDTCDLEDVTSLTPAYQSCVITPPFAIQGEHLVCVHNAEVGTTKKEIYNLVQDRDKGSGYQCGPLVDAKTKCTQHTSGDFYIKLKAGKYSNVLDSRITIIEGFTGQLLEDVLNDYLSKQCSSTADNCIIPVALSSASEGIVFFDNLRIRYKENNVLAEEKNFYDVSFTPSVIYEVDGVDLTQENTTFTLEVDLLDLVAPSVPEDKNYTVRAGIDPGFNDEAKIMVKDTKDIDDNQTAPTDLAEAALFYKGLLNNLLADHDALLEVLDYESEITDAVRKLTNYKTTLDSLNSSNRTDAQAEQERAKISREMTALLRPLPQYIEVLERVSRQLAPLFGDITDAVVLANQKDDVSKKKIYTLQQSMTITADASAFSLVKFDKKKEEGTVVEQTVRSSISDAYLVTLIPTFLASSADDIIFSVKPEILQAKNPLIVRWHLSQLSAEGVTYLFATDIIRKLDRLTSVVIPKVIPKETPQQRARCGDSICSVLEVGSRKIPLEDKHSCPQDCKTQVPWMPLITTVALFALLLFYFVIYKGKGNFQELLAKLKRKKGKAVMQAKGKLFTSPADEANLRKYVATSLRRGVNSAMLTKTLLSKGWTKSQIDAIFKSLKK